MCKKKITWWDSPSFILQIKKKLVMFLFIHIPVHVRKKGSSECSLLSSYSLSIKKKPWSFNLFVYHEKGAPVISFSNYPSCKKKSEIPRTFLFIFDTCIQKKTKWGFHPLFFWKKYFQHLSHIKKLKWFSLPLSNN